MKTFKNIIFIAGLCVLTIITLNLNAQYTEVNIEDLDCGPDPNGIIQTYWDIDTYSPFMDGQLLHDCPIKTIEINFNIFQDENGEGNFQNTPEDIEDLLEVLDMINDRYANYAPSDPILAPEDELPNYDSKIRFSLGEPGEERIDFYPDDEEYKLHCCYTGTDFIDFLETKHPDRLEQLNIFFVSAFQGISLDNDDVFMSNHGSGYYNTPPDVIFEFSECSVCYNLSANAILDGTGKVDHIDIVTCGSCKGCAPSITLQGGDGSEAEAYCEFTGGWGGSSMYAWEDLEGKMYFFRYQNTGENSADDGMATNLSHELAHILTLRHTYDGDPYPDPTLACINDDDYLWDVFGLYPGNCPHLDGKDCEDEGWDAYTSDEDQCTNNIMGDLDSKYISPRQAGKIHRSLALLSSRQYVRDDAYIEDAPLVITDNQTWDFNIKLYRDIIIEPGAELTLTCKVVMPWQGSIIVKQNAKLIVDGGTITCDSKNQFWQGIQVWGTSGVHQYTIEDYCAHGTLILKNGAIVENALIGAYMGGYQENGHGDPAKHGGIIQVVGNNSLVSPSASFINNFFSVSFNPYENRNPNYPYEIKPNRSYFHNALFEANDNYIKSDYWSKTQVRVFGVDGVSFKGCTFINNQTASNLGRGIYCAPGPAKTVNSGFRVSYICTSQTHPCPEESWDKCEFINLAKGIEGFNTELGTFTVEDAIFENNSYGIKMSNVNNASVLFSDFYIGPASAKDKDACDELSSGYGIFMDNCTGFAIEENYFTKYTGAPTGNYTGLRIAETNATDEVYLNRFDGVSYANYTEGRNWGDVTWNGLEFLCNENQDNFADFYIVPDPIYPSGVQSNQGNTVDPAGNEFSPIGASFHILNLGDHNINYYYCGDGSLCPNQIPIYGVNIFNYQASSINQCLSHYGSGGGGGQEEGRTVLDDDEKQEREQQYAQALTDYNNVTALYESLKDGGNTEVLKTEVETAWPSDMWELRAELLGKSPHLSMEVLKEAADKTDVLPESVLFEILAANPDELKKEELLKYLEDKENPLPQYMVDILRQVAAGTTYKTVLQNQMSGFNQLKTRAAHDMIRSILNDTVTNLSELRNWLDNLGGIRADHQIINTYLVEDNVTDALTLANMLPELYHLEGNELSEHHYYMDMLNLKIGLLQQNRSLFDLDSLEVNNLVIIADNSHGVAGAQAKGILELAYGYEFCNCLNIADTLGYKSSGSIDYDLPGTVYGFEISAKPNPAKDWVAFNYTLPGDETEGIIKISDVSGKLAGHIKIEGKQGQKIWDTRQVNPGVYFYILNVSGYSKSGKIVISK